MLDSATFNCTGDCLLTCDEAHLKLLNSGNLDEIDHKLPKRDVHVEGSRRHNDELNSLYRSHNIVRMIKSRIVMDKSCSQNGRS